MSLRIEQGDITKYKVDAIVNAANSSLLGGGGVDGAIHSAAGPALLEECRTLGGCNTGDAKITRAYNLEARIIIHTVGPVYSNAKAEECKQLLTECYKNSLAVALLNECSTIAFPLISAGVYGYPKKEALKVAVDTIRQYGEPMDAVIVLFDRDAFAIASREYPELIKK